MRACWRIEVLSREQFSRVREVECKFRDVDFSNISHSFLANEMFKTGRSLLFFNKTQAKKTQRILNNIVWFPLVQEARSSLLYYHDIIMTSKHGWAWFQICKVAHSVQVWIWNKKARSSVLRSHVYKGLEILRSPSPPEGVSEPWKRFYWLLGMHMMGEVWDSKLEVAAMFLGWVSVFALKT